MAGLPLDGVDDMDDVFWEMWRCGCFSLTLHIRCVTVMDMDSKQVIKFLKEDGWYKVAQKGSHIQFKHPTKKGRVTVVHPKKDITIKTLQSIEKQSGLNLRK